MSAVKLSRDDDEEDDSVEECTSLIQSSAIAADKAPSAAPESDAEEEGAGQVTVSGVELLNSGDKIDNEADDDVTDVIEVQPTFTEESDNLLGKYKNWSTGLFQSKGVVSSNETEFGEILNLIPLLPPDSCCLSYNVCSLRSSMRNLFRIKGTRLEDTCVSLCCTSCALAQMKREVLSRAASGSLPIIKD